MYGAARVFRARSQAKKVHLNMRGFTSEAFELKVFHLQMICMKSKTLINLRTWNVGEYKQETVLCFSR